MVKLKLYLVSADSCEYRAIKNLSESEREMVYCYAVNPSIPKFNTNKIKIINEWQLLWYNNRYQFLQYYEYGLIPHCVKNSKLLEGLTHVGLLHNDVLFAPNSINNMIIKLEENPNKIFYIILRKNNQLYFNKDQLKSIAHYLAPRLNIEIDVNKVWEGEWLSESLSVTPVEIFRKFGQFMLDYQYELEEILNTNRWGLMNNVKHRLCGFTERLWGIYLASCDMLFERMEVEHDRDAYRHKHLEDKEKFLKKF